jgi:hypothetical protein
MQAGSGIAEIVALEISRHEKKSVDEARKRIYLLDSKVLLSHIYHYIVITKVLPSPSLQYLPAFVVSRQSSVDTCFLWIALSVRLNLQIYSLLVSFSTSLIFNPHVYRDWLQRPGMNHCKNSRNHMHTSIPHALLSFLPSRYATPGLRFMNFHISPFQDTFAWRHMKIFSTAMA